MTPVLPRPAPGFDTSSAGFTAAARDLGEVIALLAGGIRPDPETLSRLNLSLRALQGFVIREAEDQAAREAIHAAISATKEAADVWRNTISVEDILLAPATLEFPVQA